MDNTTLITGPLSHSQTCDTFRAAACIARRTGRGTATFVGLDISCPVPDGLVAEHRAKAGTRRIQHGLRHTGLRHLPSVKGASSRLLRKQRPDIEQRYRDGVLWSASYFAASTGGAPLEQIKCYLQQQRASAAP